MTITTDPTVRTPGRRHRSVAGLPPNVFPENGVLELSEAEVARREANGMPADATTMPQDEQTAPAPASRTLVTGGNPDELFLVPHVSGDFINGDDLAAIGQALIDQCDEFEALRDAMDEKDIVIRYFWRKKAAKQADRVKAGTLGKASGLLKHVAKGEYVVQVAADAAYGKTRWQIEALVFHELLHIRIEMVFKGPKGAKVEVPQLKTRAHDLECFWEEWERYGAWRFDLAKAEEVFKVRQPSLL